MYTQLPIILFFYMSILYSIQDVTTIQQTSLVYKKNQLICIKFHI